LHELHDGTSNVR
jgi:hypothetical protein